MLALALAPAAVARAEGSLGIERPRVAIAVAGCDASLAREVRRIAAVELRATLLEAAADATGGLVTRVIATCGSGDARLDVDDPITGKSLQRTIALTDAPPGERGRLLALAIAELVAASWSELETNPRPKVRATAAPYPAREAARAAVVSRAIEAAAVFDAHVLSSGDVLFGGGARVAVWLTPRLFLSADGVADYRVLDRAAGTVSVIMPSASAAVGLSRRRDAWLRPAVTAGLRAGYVWMTGTASGAAASGTQQQGAFLGPEVGVQLGGWAGARVHPVLALSAGVHLLGVRGTVSGGGGDVDAVGWWTGVSAGVVLR
ncbi:MAG TPA: hypothetical protein VHO67_17115 [Polyangia bacterium]|nr:hypothetical protein [Polyangia bacterium]